MHSGSLLNLSDLQDSIKNIDGKELVDPLLENLSYKNS